MIIKCPQCSTGYSIPENMIGDKPRKMRCSRCKNVFTIIRRKETAPTGYEEFTGSQQLPEEFAFLREAPAAPQQPAPFARPIPPSGSPPAQPTPAVPAPTPQPPEPAAQPGSAPQEPPPPMPEPPAPSPASPEPAPSPAIAPTYPPRQSAPSAVADIYGSSSASAWEMEAPLELSGYAMMEETSTGGQLAGKLMTAIVVLIVLFFVFVAFRNGWSISLPELGAQISFAFSGEKLEELPDEVDDLEATVAQRRTIIANDKTPYLVITGEVLSDAPIAKENVIIRGRLIDASGDVRGEVRAPCGKVSDDSVIEAIEKGAAQGLYRSEGALYNCRISGHGSTVFQLIFEDLPVDFDDSFGVEVKPVAATLAP